MAKGLWALPGYWQIIFLVMSFFSSTLQAQPPVEFSDVLRLPVGASPVRYSYGLERAQFGELWLPPEGATGQQLLPVVVIVHGGCWLSAYGLDYTRAAGAALAARGFAVWSFEYRRLGDEGGGWPGTFMDAELGLAALQDLAEQHPLDLSDITVMGHSAGGHLALWAAARTGATGTMVVKKVVGLGAVVDLERYAAPDGCGSQVVKLMGGSALQRRIRYTEVANVIGDYFRSGGEIHLLYGTLDLIVPMAHGQLAVESLQLPKSLPVELHAVANTGHFDWFYPSLPAWDAVLFYLEGPNR